MADEKMLPDCKPVKGKVPGPANIQLCATHGHVLDVEAKTIVAKTKEDYEKKEKAKTDKVWKIMTDVKGEPMAGDCKPVRGKLKGSPENIQLCEKHKHVLDVKQKKIIAKTEDEFMRNWEKALESMH